MKVLLLAALLISGCTAKAEPKFTKQEVSTCSVITAENSDVCDPEGDIQNGDIDAA